MNAQRALRKLRRDEMRALTVSKRVVRLNEQLIKEDRESGDVDFVRMGEHDKRQYDKLRSLIEAGRRVAAKTCYWNMDTAAREQIYECEASERDIRAFEEYIDFERL